MNGQIIDRRRLSILLHNCATHIEQDDFEPKLVRETLTQLDAYFRFHAKRPSPLFASMESASENTSETIHKVSSSFDESSTSTARSTSGKNDSADEGDEYDRLGREYKPKTTTTSSSMNSTTPAVSVTASIGLTVPPKAPNIKQPTPTAPPIPMTSHASSSLAENTPSASTLSSSSTPIKSTSFNASVSSSSSFKDKKCFQRPVNPSSTLICNGYVDLLLPRERPVSSSSSTTVHTSNNLDSFLPTYVRYPQVLASLVEGRPNTLEETTLWIQRRTVDSLMNQAKLEVIKSVPLRWLVNVRPLLSSEVGKGEYGFSIQVYQQPIIKSTTSSTINNNNKEDIASMTVECIQEWIIKVDEENGCADWIATLLSARNAAKEKARTLLLQKKTGVSSSTSHTNNTVNSNTATTISHVEKYPSTSTAESLSTSSKTPTPSRQQESSILQEESSSSSSSKVVSSGTTANGELISKMTIKELRSIAHGAGYDTRGMERADLEQIAYMNAPMSAFYPPPSVSPCSKVSSANPTFSSSTVTPAATEDTQVPLNSSTSSFSESETTHRYSQPKVVAVEPEKEEARRRTAQHVRKNFDPLNHEYDPFLAPPVPPPTTQPVVFPPPTSSSSHLNSSASSNHSKSSTPLPNQKVPPSVNTSSFSSSSSSSGNDPHPTTSTDESSFHFNSRREEKKTENSTSSNINAKYAQAMSDSSSTTTNKNDSASSSTIPSSEEQQGIINNRLKRQILLMWALIPPTYNMLRSIDDLLATVHTVFPPCLGLPSHAHFNNWIAVSKGDLMDTGDSAIMKPALDDEKLKKCVRKLRFFLHPDRLPRELNPEQVFVCKMLWDITNDSWEEYQKHKENLDWVK